MRKETMKDQKVALGKSFNALRTLMCSWSSAAMALESVARLAGWTCSWWSTAISFSFSSAVMYGSAVIDDIVVVCRELSIVECRVSR